VTRTDLTARVRLFRHERLGEAIMRVAEDGSEEPYIVSNGWFNEYYLEAGKAVLFAHPTGMVRCGSSIVYNVRRFNDHDRGGFL
jgi:hypothetical protein